MAQDYSNSLNLPKTDFPMRASLPVREPETLKKWEDMDLYNQLMEKGKDKPTFMLHDGPPFANGDIHLGHALNKILKDIIMKYKTMAGYRTPYVPGWDTHGLPIERQAIKKLGVDKNKTSPVEFRKICREFAEKYAANQRDQFKRLGITGDWEHPYLTLQPEYEGKQTEIFALMVKNGYIYKGLKPVVWCTECETALAEAEIEYQDDKTNSIYVKFPLKDDKGKFDGISGKIYFVIWTTTTWSLPGNVAICVNPRFEYSLVKNGDEVYVMASELVSSAMKAAGIEGYETLRTINGAELEYMVCTHPFLERDSLIITGEHVTLDAGTGCVHTAPGHGADDYMVCRNYDLPMIVPVEDDGRLNSYAGKFEGMFYEKSNQAIVDELKSSGLLFAIEEITHSYPHCWRCSKPIVYRATDQWFCSVGDFKDKAIEAIHNVEWIPEWGEDRIINMVSERNDWCISRQRLWGVPIPVFYCEDCKKPILDEDVILNVAKIFGEKGSDAWFTMSAQELMPAGYKCECGCTNFTKETDTIDGWFDSGSSHYAVMDAREDTTVPADLYLEGNDQYRGWFQSSLLTSVAQKGAAPYKAVVTHGFVIDEEKRKMSKSLGNGIAPLDIVKEYGADILRLWTASADYRADIRISKDILKQLSEVYRKIRNTARYILGSLSDFDPDTNMVTEFEEIDRWALMRLNKLLEKVRMAYDRYEFHVLYHAIHNFCVVDMSNFYLDVIKDRVYCEKTDDRLRRSSQSAMYLILENLTKMIAPVLAFTAEEIWQYMPHRKSDDAQSIWFQEFSQVDNSFYSKEFEEKWDLILAIRDDVSKALETARAAKVIGHSLGAKVTLYADGSSYDFLKALEGQLKTLFIVSDAAVLKLDEAPADAVDAAAMSKVKIAVSQPKGEKCARCWMIQESVGKDAAHPDLCERCASVVE